MKEISKMTKKEKREFYSKQRNVWTINPTTRKPDNPAAYKRNAAKKEAHKAISACL